MSKRDAQSYGYTPLLSRIGIYLSPNGAAVSEVSLSTLFSRLLVLLQ